MNRSFEPQARVFFPTTPISFFIRRPPASTPIMKRFLSVNTASVIFKVFRSCCIIFIILLLLTPIPASSESVPDTSSTSESESIQERKRATYQQLEIFANVLGLLEDNYVEEIKIKDVIEGAISGMLLSLDPHSSYMTSNEFKELQEETRGSFTGIGIEITIVNGMITVVSPIEGTPADRAGLKAKDQVIKIDGEATSEMTPTEAVKRLRGPVGSTVTVSIYRDGWKELQDFVLTRDLIPLQSIKAVFMEPGLAYIRITNFQSQTTIDLEKELDRLQTEQPIKGMVLDLRNNPGGLLDQAISVSDIFLDQGLIVSTRGRHEDQTMSFEAEQGDSANDYPLVLLINEGSASASEIVAGAIQDQKRGILVGSKSFGKGSVQTLIPMPEGAGLRMTTARYYTPSGRSIQATGINPDVEVPFLPYHEENKDNEKGETLREADLKNHIEGARQDSRSRPASEKTTENRDLKLLQQQLQRDNQLRSALNILKSLDLYSQYRQPQPQAPATLQQP